MTDNSDDWIPIRKAVAELTAIYHEAFNSEYSAARAAAIAALMRSLAMGYTQSQSHSWFVHYLRISGNSRFFGNKDYGDSIIRTFWRYCNELPPIYTDWVVGEFHVERPIEGRLGGISAWAIDVFVNRQTVPLIGSAEKPTRVITLRNLPSVERRGRPRKWNWDGAMCAIIAKANAPSGLPEGYGAQAEIGRMLAKWFSENQNGEPTPSEIGLRAAQIMTAIDNSRK